MRTIKIKHGEIGRYDDVSPFIVEKGDLELQIQLPDPDGDYFVVSQASITADGKKKLLVGRDGRVSLQVSIGELRLAVKRYIRGRLIESYGIEPLDVISADGMVSAYPELSILQRRAAGLEKTVLEEREARKQACADALKTIEEKTAEAADNAKKSALEAVHKLTVAFLRYAYTDYRRNIYVNTRSISIEKFLAEFGFSEKDFTAEELAEIKEEAKI